MEFPILGPLEVVNDHGAVALRGITPRAVFADVRAAADAFATMVQRPEDALISLQRLV